jgi:nucleoid-associated protein YgaU
MSIENLSGAPVKADARSKSLQKVTIKHETARPRVFSGQITALFNPSELRYTREAAWDVQPVSGLALLTGAQRVAFHTSKPQTLAIDLFFDTYEQGADVTAYTNEVARLATVFQELHRPPRCQLWWGQYCLLRGVLTNLGEQYTFFLPDGTPVRATLSCTFTEAIDADERSLLPELHSADVPKRRVVRRGDTLSSIALELYNDASQWRRIASANRIDDPRGGLRVGATLLIPPIREGK